MNNNKQAVDTTEAYKRTQEQLTQEWRILHGDYEKYEQYSLIIKLVSITLCLLCLALSIHTLLTLLFVFTLWLQEGIWKTYQARSEKRILEIEGLLQEDYSTSSAQPFVLYSSWMKNKPGALGLVLEYAANAIRPTVAYPYVALLIISLLSNFILV